ncbi:MAG: glycosyltransferase family 4 protein [Candidatus Binataceae bacterium]
MIGSGKSTPGREALRVLHVTPWYAPAWSYGGVVEAALHLTRNLARAGANVRVLTTDASARDRRLASQVRGDWMNGDGIETYYCPRRAADSIAPALLARLPAMVGWADIVHLHAAYSFPTIPTLACARILGRPVVWTPHGALQRWPGSRRVVLKAAWERLCTMVGPRRMIMHLTSEEEARESANRIGAAARVIVGNGVEIPDRVSRTKSPGKLRLGFIGRIDPKKGLENLLDACAILAGRGSPAFSLAIAGSGARDYGRTIAARVAALAERADVSMAGEVRGEAKERWFSQCDVLVAPSFTENFGLVIAEALAREVAVIASRGTPWSILEARGCGLWIANDPPSIADAIERAATMPLAEMGARGRALMIEKFSWQRCAREMMRCYEELLGLRGAVDCAAAGPARGAA